MTTKELVKVFDVLIGNTGKVVKTTIDQRYDATACTRIGVRVFMDYGFREPVKGEGKKEEDCEYPNGTEPPEPEMIQIQLTEAHGIVHYDVQGESFHAGAFWNGEELSVIHDLTTEQFTKMVYRLIFEGDWKGIDKRLEVEDPMGCLSDYE